MTKAIKICEFEQELIRIEQLINVNPSNAQKQLLALKTKHVDAEKRLQAYCELLIGRCIQRIGYLNKAYEAISTATVELVSLSALREAAMGYHYLSQICVSKREMGSAQENCLKGIELAKKCRDWYSQLCLYMDLGAIFNGCTDYKCGLSAYLKSKSIFINKVKDKMPSLAKSQDYVGFIIDLNIAINYFVSDNCETALQYLDGIGDAAEKVYGGLYLNQYHIEYANVCFRLARIEDAVKHAQLLLKNLRADNQTTIYHVPMNCLNMCLSLLLVGKNDLAYEILMVLKPMIERDDDPRILAMLYKNFAYYYKDMGDLSSAISSFEQYISYTETREFRRMEDSKKTTHERMELQKTVNRQKKAEEKYARERIAIDVLKKTSEAKGVFMSRMSHEIRTPLNAIIGYNSLASKALMETQKEENHETALIKIHDCLEKSSLASKQLLGIINDVLDISAIESGKIKIAHEKFDFKGIISSITAIFYTQAKTKNVEFEVVFESFTDEWLIGDEVRVTQVLNNLLSNAIKFTNEYGKVQLLVQQTSVDENTTRVHFEVNDSGIGISKDFLENLWSPFEQADSSISRRFGGSGLGLSITKNLVELMNGRIEVKSEIGVGSTFSVDLTFEKTVQPQNVVSYDFSKINALIVDDDQTTCEYVKLLFDRFEVKNTTALSGFEALEAFDKAQNEGAPFTVCIVDWRMPQMDGLKTAIEIRKLTKKRIPIIILTAYDFTDIADEAAQAGINTFLSKPLFQSSLFNLLVSVCEEQTVESASLNRSVDLKGLRVLLVEDNKMNMEITCEFLKSAGIAVDSAYDGEQAVAMFNSSPKGTYDLILMDVQMPIMDGYTATRTIRASKHPDAKEIPIIALTADAFAENVAEALNAGMNSHIAKPVNFPVLFETLSLYAKRSH